MTSLEQILAEVVLESHFGIDPNKLRGLYPYGSLSYGTTTPNSDYDYVAIVDMKKNDYLQYESDEVDIHFLSEDYYKLLLIKHDIMALECYFNPEPIIKYETDFILNLVTLRHKISSIVSNSWVKAKKKVKLENENDYIGYKSLFHSMRILDFAIQLAETGKIYDFKKVSYIWNDILDMVKNNKSIDEIMNHYKPTHNANATKFRELAPKE